MTNRDRAYILAAENPVDLETAIQNALDAAEARGYLSVAGRLHSLFEAIKHGDEHHQAWLKETIHKHFFEVTKKFEAAYPTEPEK